MVEVLATVEEVRAESRHVRLREANNLAFLGIGRSAEHIYNLRSPYPLTLLWSDKHLLDKVGSSSLTIYNNEACRFFLLL